MGGFSAWMSRMMVLFGAGVLVVLVGVGMMACSNFYDVGSKENDQLLHIGFFIALVPCGIIVLVCAVFLLVDGIKGLTGRR